MADGRWQMAYDLWQMADGRSHTACGNGSAYCDIRYADMAIWHMVYWHIGAYCIVGMLACWHMAHGIWHMAHKTREHTHETPMSHVPACCSFMSRTPLAHNAAHATLLQRPARLLLVSGSN